MSLCVYLCVCPYLDVMLFMLYVSECVCVNCSLMLWCQQLCSSQDQIISGGVCIFCEKHIQSKHIMPNRPVLGLCTYVYVSLCVCVCVGVCVCVQVCVKRDCHFCPCVSV